ncbi:MAG: phosphatidate cytidylyltransferase, partial [Tenericutes bacterium]|nr:phosphatidate cytidylyltransferase [Mycoplasmatota bacterium]
EKDKKIPLFIKCLTLFSFVLLMMSGVPNTYSFTIDYRYIITVIFMCLMPLLIYGDREVYSIEDSFYILGLTLFLGISFNFLITIRNVDLFYLLYVLFVTFATDTFAHFYGTKIGKIKLCPTISPNKTVEGMLGGTFFGTFIGTMFFITFINYNISLIYMTLISLSISLMAQFGDLFFSSIKRRYKVKDFGKIMPGHGGILDRLDSLLFALLAFVLVVTII